MSVRSQKNRIDDIEISLTPKEWAIRLLDEMRQYPKEEDYLKAITETEFEECMLTKPLLKLRQQAEIRRPGQNLHAKEERAELSRKLCREFHELKMIIYNINQATRNKTESAAQLKSASWSLLNQLVLEERLERLADAIAACIRRTGLDRDNFAGVMGLIKSFYNENPPTSASLIQQSADGLAELMTNLLETEAGVKIIQARYFDGHPILFRNIEDALKENIQAATFIIRMFQGCFSFRQRGRFRLVRTTFRSIDVEELKRQARAIATIDILKDDGITCEDCWKVFRAMLKPEFQTSVNSLKSRIVGPE